MFGLIYSLIVGTGLEGHSIMDKVENDNRRVNNVDPDEMTYLDTKGKTRFVSDNKQAFYQTINGDMCLVDAKGNIRKNCTADKREEKRNASYEKAIANGETTYCIDEREHRFEHPQGQRFKDLKTGDVYLIRRIRGKYYYIDFKTGDVVRKTDDQLKEDKILGTTPHEIDIEKFNKTPRGKFEGDRFLDHFYVQYAKLYK